MWIFVGASIVCIVYPIVEEWLQRRRDVEHLAAMRKHAALGDRWDVDPRRRVPAFNPTVSFCISISSPIRSSAAGSRSFGGAHAQQEPRPQNCLAATHFKHGDATM
jgi:hypothetical protein